MRKKKILVVDDDVPLADSMKLVLEDTGNFDVCVETDSVSALATARNFQPDVVLLDIVMPGLDGGDVSAQLKQDPFLSSVPIIIVTALVANSEAGRDDGIDSGGQMMIAKPVRFRKLLHAIETTLVASVR